MKANESSIDRISGTKKGAEILNHIPPHRADHLVYFNPGDLEHPIGLNLLANVSLDERHLVASGIVGAFKSIWRDSWGPRLEYILHNALSALLACSNTTLLALSSSECKFSLGQL